MEPVVVRNTQSPGDVIVLTAAIRDIARTYPGRFRFGIDTIERPIWLNNPDVDLTLNAGRRIVAKYPLVHQSNQQKVHFMWGFLEHLNQQLKVDAKLLDFRPALYLTADERATPPCGLKKPYWVFASGGKKDFTAKWWDPEEWKKVVAVMSRWTTLVQVGGGSHVHPPVENTVNLVGKTSMRELFRVIYHAEGVMCVVTCLMHIAAAFNKPCVVVAGGREPYWWEAYTEEGRTINMRRGQPLWAPKRDNFIPHRYIHTIGNAPDNIGSLPCCRDHGCWSGRVGIRPASDNHRYCRDYVTRHGMTLPRCLSLISFEKVLQEVDWYYTSGILDKSRQSTMVQMLVSPAVPEEKSPDLPPALPAAPPPVKEPEPVETPVESVQIGAMVKDAGVAFNSLIRYGRIRASVLQVQSRVKGFQVLSKNSSRASWLGWMEEPVFPRGKEWYERLMNRLDRDPGAAWGVVCWKPWAKTPGMPAHPLDPNRSILYYLRRGWILLPKRVADELPWETFTDAGFETELSLCLHQRNVKLRDAGELIEG